MNGIPLRMRHYGAPHDPRVVVAEIAGRIDVDQSMRLLEFLTGLIGQGHPRLVIDINDVEFVGDSGLDALVGAFNRAQRDGGAVVLSCETEDVLKRCKSAGLMKFYSIWPNPTEAADFLTD